MAFAIGTGALVTNICGDASPSDMRSTAELAWERLRGAGGGGGRAAELERLGQLREQGVLTEEEFAAENARVLHG